MTSKQLANVLIKILGLSVCLQGIPSFVSGFLSGLFSLTAARGGGSHDVVYAAGSGVYLILGIFLVIRSRYVAEKLFRSDE